MIQRFFNIPAPAEYVAVPSGEMEAVLENVIEVEIYTDIIEIEID